MALAALEGRVDALFASLARSSLASLPDALQQAILLRNGGNVQWETDWDCDWEDDDWDDGSVTSFLLADLCALVARRERTAARACLHPDTAAAAVAAVRRGASRAVAVGGAEVGKDAVDTRVARLPYMLALYAELCARPGVARGIAVCRTLPHMQHVSPYDLAAAPLDTYAARVVAAEEDRAAVAALAAVFKSVVRGEHD